MTLKSEPYYWVECDCCGARMEYGDFSAMSTAGDALDFGDGYFAEVGDEHLCDQCWTYPDGDAADDEPVRAHRTHPVRAEVQV